MGHVKTNDTAAAAPTLQEIPLFEKYKDNVLFSEQYSQKNGFETRQKKFAKQCRKGQEKEENIPGLISAARQSHRIIVVKTAYDVSARACVPTQSLHTMPRNPARVSLTHSLPRYVSHVDEAIEDRDGRTDRDRKTIERRATVRLTTCVPCVLRLKGFGDVTASSSAAAAAELVAILLLLHVQFQNALSRESFPLPRN